MRSSSKLLQIFFLSLLAILLLTGAGQAESIAFVTDGAANRWDSTGVEVMHVEQPLIDLLVANGYDVTVLMDTMKGNPLSTEQIDVLESFDLIVVGRGTNSGDYNDPTGWNSITKPIILQSVYLSRNSRWQWFNSADLINNGRSGSPGILPVENHPIFTGLTPDNDGLIYPWDPAVGCGNVSLANWAEVGDEGLVLATSWPDTLAHVDGSVAIVYWPADAGFYPETIQFAGGPRLLLPAGAQEDAGTCPLQASYNLTPDGNTLFLNAVAWMLGKEVGVAEKPATPSQFALAQNFPNPFNPSTTIKFSVPSTSNVNIRVFNMLGREVATLTNGVYQAGDYNVTWNGLDASGNSVESGVYLYKLETENSSSMKKMVLIK